MKVGIGRERHEGERRVAATPETVLQMKALGVEVLIESGAGSIINIGGLTGHKGGLHRSHVVTAKGGLAAMTKALALDLAEHAITVNCVVPGTIDTQRGLPGAPERPGHRNAVPPIGRRGAPEEIAAMVRMLCGPDARYVTGQSIHVNGGGLML